MSGWLLMALPGMVSGAITLLAWKYAGLGERLYEIVPGFATNCLVIWAVNGFHRKRDSSIIQEYEEVAREARPTPR